jgi:RND family efflux transporter MFP subunit
MIPRLVESISQAGKFILPNVDSLKISLIEDTIMHKSPWSLPASVLLFCLIGCGRKNEFQAPPPPAVTVILPAVEDVVLFETFPGRVEARDSVEIVARVPGILEHIHVQDGARVREGDLLFTLEQDGYRAAVNAARADLARARAGLSLAEAALSRKQKAFEVQAVSELDILSAEADVEAARAAVQVSAARLETADLNFAYTTLHASMDGILSSTAVSTGNLVGPGATTRLSRLVRTDTANVIFHVDERRLLPKLRRIEGSAARGLDTLPPVNLELADGDRYTPEGSIDFIDNVVDRGTGTLRLRAVFDNPSGLLFDGMFVRVLIPVAVPAALLIPEEAIQRDLIGPFVYVVDSENTVESRYIEIGALTDGRRIVTKGLTPADRVISRGLQRVRPGAAVRIDAGKGN